MGLEFWRLQRVREMRVEKARRGVMGRGDGEEVGRWRRELVANCAYAPLTVGVLFFYFLFFIFLWGGIADCERVAALVGRERHDWAVSGGCFGFGSGGYWVTECVGRDGIGHVRSLVERLVGYIRDIVRLEHSFMKAGGFLCFYV